MLSVGLPPRKKNRTQNGSNFKWFVYIAIEGLFEQYFDRSSQIKVRERLTLYHQKENDL